MDKQNRTRLQVSIHNEKEKDLLEKLKKRENFSGETKELWLAKLKSEESKNEN